jgi:hypothetical protein
MKQYTITIPNEKNQFFLELMTSLGFSVLDNGDFNMEDINIPQWQKDILDERLTNASVDSSKNWNDVKDDFTFNS